MENRVELKQVAKGQIVQFVSMHIDETSWTRIPVLVQAKVVKQRKLSTELLDITDNSLMLCEPEQLVNVILQ
jgi:hypothetical protein